MLRLENIRIRKELNINEILSLALKKYRVNPNDITNFHIFKKSIDARKKEDISYVYTLDVEVKDEGKYSNIKKVDSTYNGIAEKIDVKRVSKLNPVIVGSGPAGLFCAKYLVDNGIKPIVIEQGKKVEERIKDVGLFREKGILNPKSNVQFGEGGAGTFSDGKLTSGISSKYSQYVLKDFVSFGAPEEIAYINKPHIGTDNLVSIVKNMRDYIIDNGGEVSFEEKFLSFESENGKVVAAITDKRRIETDCIVLAIGHSARDTFEMLHEKDIKMEKKTFSCGVRIEHKQELINKAQFGDKTNLRLPPADYKMAYHNEKTKRSCYTFCMCPGGEVIASSSEEGTIVTNGMSSFKRDKENANSAVLVNVTPEDFKGESPLEGMYFQRDIEKKAYEMGGGGYIAPCQRLESFLNTETINEVKASYMPGVKEVDLNELFPKFITETLKEGILYFDTKIKGFADGGAILTAPETRSSSPISMPRDEKLMSVNMYGLYPCGEGPGHAGGIMSAAVDGIKVAYEIMVNK